MQGWRKETDKAIVRKYSIHFTILTIPCNILIYVVFNNQTTLLWPMLQFSTVMWLLIRGNKFALRSDVEQDQTSYVFFFFRSCTNWHTFAWYFRSKSYYTCVSIYSNWLRWISGLFPPLASFALSLRLRLPCLPSVTILPPCGESTSNFKVQ